MTDPITVASRGATVEDKSGDSFTHNDAEVDASQPDSSRWASVVSPSVAGEVVRVYVRHLLASPRFAYGLAALILLALPLTRIWTVEQLSRPDSNLAIANLVSERDGGSLQAVEIPDEANHFLLLLNLVPQRAYTDYTVVVDPLDSEGQESWRLAGIEPSIYGNFNLLVPRRYLPAGPYLISLFGRNGESLELAVKYKVQIKYQEKFILSGVDAYSPESEEPARTSH